MARLYRRVFPLTLCALTIVSAWVVRQPRSAVPGATPAATSTHLYRMNDAQTALVPMNARTLADRRGAPGIALIPQGTTLSTPWVVAHPGGTALATLFYRGDGSRAQDLSIRVIDARTGRARGPLVHPAVPVWIQDIAPDGTRLYALRRDQETSGSASPLQRTTYYVLSTATGRVLHARTIRHSCCGFDVYDVARQRLYTLSAATAGDAHSASQVPQLLTEDLRTGRQIGHLALPGLHAGSWNTTRQLDGAPLMRAWTPGLALSPDGAHLAIVDPSSDQLTLIDTATLRVARTVTLHRAQSLPQRLGAFLGLLPQIAYAKGAEGVSLSAQYSPDGRLLYVTGTQGSVGKSGTFTWTQLGLRVVDVRSGTIVADRFKGTPLMQTIVAPDGSVYVVTSPPGPGSAGCPCTLQRLDPRTLATEARRGDMGGGGEPLDVYILSGR